jgi:hypothetical protein
LQLVGYSYTYLEYDARNHEPKRQNTYWKSEYQCFTKFLGFIPPFLPKRKVKALELKTSAVELSHLRLINWQSKKLVVLIAMEFGFDKPVDREWWESAALWITTAEYNSS